MAKGCGQEYTVNMAHSDATSDGGVAVEVIVDSYIKKIDCNVSAQESNAGVGGVAITIGVGNRNQVDKGFFTGTGDWFDPTDSSARFLIGAGVIFTRGLVVPQNTEQQMRYSYHTYRKVKAGEVLYMRLDETGTMSDMDGYATVTLEPMCYKHRKTNWKSVYAFAHSKYEASGGRWFWYAPCDGWLRNVEGYMSYVTGGEQEPIVVVSPSMDPDPTAFTEQDTVQSNAMILHTETQDSNEIVRNWHPGWYFRRGDKLRIETGPTLTMNFNLYGDFIPDHGSEFFVSQPVTFDASDWEVYEVPVTMKVGQVKINGEVTASANRDGWAVVLNNHMPGDYAWTDTDLDESTGIGVGALFGEENAAVSPGAATTRLFTIPLDLPSGGHERYQDAKILDEIWREGSVLASRGHGADLTNDGNFVVEYVGTVLNKGKRYRTRTYAQGPNMYDLALDIV